MHKKEHYLSMQESSLRLHKRKKLTSVLEMDESAGERENVPHDKIAWNEVSASYNKHDFSEK